MGEPLIIAIDPGPEKSGVVVYDLAERRPVQGEILWNPEILRRFQSVCGFRGVVTADRLAIEMIASYGMPAGASLFETCVWIGRFIEAHGGEYHKIYRREVKMFLCGSMRAKDANVRQALLDRFGGSREKAIGTKKKPGPLYGFKADMWAALGVAVTYAHGEWGP